MNYCKQRKKRPPSIFELLKNRREFFVSGNYFFYIMTLRMNGLSFLPDSDAFLRTFLCYGEHQLDSVQLVHFAGTGIVVNGHDIGVGEA